jgi:hypothetical protein
MNSERKTLIEVSREEQRRKKKKVEHKSGKNKNDKEK